MSTLKKKITPVSVVKVPEKISIISFEIPDFDYGDEYGESFSVQIKKGKAYFELSFIFGDLPGCCGLKELYAFGISDSKLITHSEKIAATKELFTKILTCAQTRAGNKTFLFTLVNNPPCNLIKEALKDNKLFTLVKTFPNTNGNLNELFISNS